MDGILEMVNRGVEQLLGRASGPLHFRLLMMPTVVTILAIRAGLRDAREGRRPFLWTFLTRAPERRRLLRSAANDVGRIFIVALVLDSAYQLFVLRAFYVVQLLIVAIGCAVLPYVLIRSPVARVVGAMYRRRAAGSTNLAVEAKADSEGAK